MSVCNPSQSGQNSVCRGFLTRGSSGRACSRRARRSGPGKSCWWPPSPAPARRRCSPTGSPTIAAFPTGRGSRSTHATTHPAVSACCWRVRWAPTPPSRISTAGTARISSCSTGSSSISKAARAGTVLVLDDVHELRSRPALAHALAFAARLARAADGVPGRSSRPALALRPHARRGSLPPAARRRPRVHARRDVRALRAARSRAGARRSRAALGRGTAGWAAGARLAALGAGVARRSRRCRRQHRAHRSRHRRLSPARSARRPASRRYGDSSSGRAWRSR